MGNINCAFNVINNTGEALTVTGDDDPQHGSTLSITTSPVLPNGIDTEAATCTSKGAGCEGWVYLTGPDDKVWQFKYDNPYIGSSSTPFQIAPTGHKISVDLINNTWTATCS